MVYLFFVLFTWFQNLALERSVTPFDAERKRWRLAEFQVDLLEGHSDLVTSVDTDGNTVVSARSV